jgi:hypothetical protein
MQLQQQQFNDQKKTELQNKDGGKTQHLPRRTVCLFSKCFLPFTAAGRNFNPFGLELNAQGNLQVTKI